MIDITKEKAGAFAEALETAEVGEGIIYFRGWPCSGPHRKAANEAYAAGLVTFVQRREGPSDYSFIAQKLAPKKRKWKKV